jgi:glycosyltransferase involved in cell wall biosynthesis
MVSAVTAPTAEVVERGSSLAGKNSTPQEPPEAENMGDLSGVTMIGSAPPLRGISGYCMELARNVSARLPVEFLSFRSMYPRWLYPGGDLRDDPTFPDLEVKGLTIKRVLDWYNPLGWVLAAARIRTEIVHLQHWSLPLAPVLLSMLGVLKGRRIGTVVTLHNVQDHGRGLFYSWATRLICRLADRCVVHSEQNARTAVEALGVPPEKIRRIRLGVHSFYSDGQGDPLLARQRLGLPRHAPVALFFGAIRPYKGLGVLLEAFSQVQARLPEAVLVIAGKLWMDWAPYERLVARVNGGKNVKTFLHYVETSQVKYFFEAADLVVLPYTHFDAQSAVGATALAFSKPMIVSNVGALPELVKDPRCVVAPDDADALGERLLSALMDEDFMEKAAADAAEKGREHSWEEIAEDTVGLYREMLGE